MHYNGVGLLLIIYHDAYGGPFDTFRYPVDCNAAVIKSDFNMSHGMGHFDLHTIKPQ